MRNNRFWWVLIALFLVGRLPLTHARKKESPASIRNGDPPPGNAMALSVPQARTKIKKTAAQNFPGVVKACVMGSCVDYTGRHHTLGVRFNPAGFEIIEAGDNKIQVDFRTDQDYLVPYHPLSMSCSGARCFSVRRLAKSSGPDWHTYEWQDEATAQQFADAFNRLLYAVHQNEDLTGYQAFAVAAKAWRQNPAKPALSPEADRERILAENAVKEKNLDAAIDHYEGAVEVQPTWPAGWYNLAVIYAEQNNYADALDAMKHYLELVPDAPDAKDARDQMIIWEDKTKH